jgi:putative aminopeptidase FrvX
MGVAMDYPRARPEEQGRLDLGKGPGISQGANTNPVVFDLLTSAARDKGIPFQQQATGSTSPTDAREVQVSHGGVATGIIAVPLRYMHTPSEVMCLADLEATVDLVCEYCRRIRPDTDFTPW